MVPEDYNPEQFQQLLLSAGNYSAKIDNFSAKMTDSSIQDQLQCLTQVYNILRNQSIPVIKKLFAVRFVKDTLLLASLSFYECVLVTIYPWILELIDSLEKDSDQKLAQAAIFLRGAKQLPTAELSVCKNFINLIEDVIKWMGTYIQDHPYSQVKFKSAFRLLLERLPQIQKNKATNLNFFKPEDPNRYLSYYLEKESSELEGDKFAAYIRNTLDDIENGQSQDILTLMLQTGDGYIINNLIEEYDTRFEEINRKNVSKYINLLQYLHQLFLVGDIQFCNKIKLDLLPKITLFIQMLNHYKIQHKYMSAAVYFATKLAKWQQKCQELKLPTSSFQRALNVLKKEGIRSTMNQYETSVRYIPTLRITKDINKDKTPTLTFNEEETVNMIKSTKYIPIEDSKEIQLEQPSSQSKNSMKQNSQNSSSKSSVNKKAQYLEAYSKIPDKNQANQSEVKEIYFQHSNLSDRFGHHPQQNSNKPFMMNFKKTQSSEVFISDSFKGIPKALDRDRIDVIEEHSQSGLSGELSHQPSIHIKEEHQPPHLSRSQSSNIQLFQQSNKQSNQNYAQKLSKISQVSEYYQQNQQIKHTAKFSNRISYNNSRVSSSHHQGESNSRKQPINQTATLNGGKYEYDANDYMLPQQQSHNDSDKFSKKSMRVKVQKSSSILSSKNSREKMRSLIRSSDRNMDLIALSPTSKMSASKSIKVLKFNDAEQGYQLPSLSTTVKPILAIRVEKSLPKPKFAFNGDIQIQTTYTQHKDMNLGEISSVVNSCKSDSISVPLSLEESVQLDKTPSNFADLLQHTPEKVKKNTFNNKIKELEHKISELQDKKVKYQKEVFSKNQQITKLKAELPTPASQLQQENRQLLKALVKPKQLQIEKDFRLSKRQDFMGQLRPIAVSQMREQLKKQLLYSKCKIFENETIQIGMQVKDKVISLYFTFKQQVSEFNVKTIENSIKFQQNIDAKIYKIHAKKQIKFKAVITDLELIHQQCQFARLTIELKKGPRDRQEHTLALPYHLYHQLTFMAPNIRSSFNISTDWHFCCSALYSNKHYLEDFLPQGKYHEGSYLTRIQYKQKLFNYLLIIEGDKFKIEFEKKHLVEQMPIIKCLIQIFQK